MILTRAWERRASSLTLQPTQRAGAGVGAVTLRVTLKRSAAACRQQRRPRWAGHQGASSRVRHAARSRAHAGVAAIGRGVDHARTARVVISSSGHRKWQLGAGQVRAMRRTLLPTRRANTCVETVSCGVRGERRAVASQGREPVWASHARTGGLVPEAAIGAHAAIAAVSCRKGQPRTADTFFFDGLGSRRRRRRHLRAGVRRALGLIFVSAGRAAAAVDAIARREGELGDAQILRQQRRRTGQTGARGIVPETAAGTEAGVAAVGCHKREPGAAVALFRFGAWGLLGAIEACAACFCLDAAPGAGAGVQSIASWKLNHRRAAVTWEKHRRAGHQCASRLVSPAIGAAAAGIATVGCVEDVARTAQTFLPGRRCLY
mmetsp:Transcript_56229/g.131795  ORF Transcript_56229/g.131795 Transcript_56229/m.131795 type:complete len:376 (-) Transcript_56229:364-1491(-)